ncbi:MAG: phage N-6-adenine-methyltransferase [Scytonematopsis contorta HA4267-MV1]|nr:phage N-6-adenine-methyltransferase [Scytonematopsis contorta HA4267-MV1]
MIHSIKPKLQSIARDNYSSLSFPTKKNSDCWYTPPNIIQLVAKVLGGIDLDPCADDGKNVPAKTHYTAMDNGLIREWGGRVFMNPPYSCPGVWMSKLLLELETGRVKSAIALVSAATDTNWLSPVLSVQPVCFWKGRIKFLDESYQPKNSARQSHLLIYWGENPHYFQEIFESYGVVKLPLAKAFRGLLGDVDNIPSNHPSNQISPSKKRLLQKGSGSIYWRIQTNNGKDYPQAYYQWKECGRKRSKYIPKTKLAAIQQALSQKRPVIEILALLGIAKTTDSLLQDTQSIPSHTTRDNRRRKGLGSGSIYRRIITKNGKGYRQAYYHYEIWSSGKRLMKKSRYIPKELLSQVEDLDAQKVPVKEILEVLGVRGIKKI